MPQYDAQGKILSREQVLESQGLSAPSPAPQVTTAGGESTPQVTPPSEPVKTTPPATPTQKPLWGKPKQEPVKPAEPAKPAEEKVYAGKYKSVEELEKGYKELEREFHARNQQPKAEPARPETPPPAAPVTEKLVEEIPDAILEPEKFKEFVQSLPTRAARMAMEAVAAERQVNELREAWKKANPDIEQFQREVERAVANDPRSLQARSREELDALIQEHTEHYRRLAGTFVDIGRNEEREKLAGVPPTAPQVTPEQTPTSKEGTPTAPADDTDAYIREREERIAKVRGYGFGRETYSNSMNQR